MGKSRKVKKVSRVNPINGVDNGAVVEEAVNKSVLDNIAAQLQSVNPEDKICGCHGLSNLSSQPEARQKIIDDKFSRLVAPLVLESDADLVTAALGCLNNLSCQGPDMVHHLITQDILTPVLSLVSQFSIIAPAAEKHRNVQREKIIEISFNLLTNLLEETSNEEVVEIIKKSSVITNITQFMSSVVGADVRVSCLNLLECLCVESGECRDQMQQQINNIVNIISNNNNQHQVRINAALLLLAVSDDVVNNKEILGLIVSCVDGILKLDSQSIINNITSSSTNKQTIDECSRTLQSQIAALEVLTNLSSPDHGDTSGDNMEASDDEEYDDCGDDMEDGDIVDSSAPVKEFITVLGNYNIIETISAKLSVDASQLLGTESCRLIVDLHQKLLIDCYLCLGNLAEILSPHQLGDSVDRVKSLWLQICTKLCQKSESLDLADAISCAVRSLTSVVCRPRSGVSLDNVGAGELDQLVSVFTHYNSLEARNIRTNLVNTLGNLACVAARTVSVEASALVLTKLSSWLLDVVTSDQCLRVVLEGLDKIMDMFSEDDSDKVFVEAGLLSKLKHVHGALKNRLSKEKKQLQEEDKAVASTVKLNLQRFIVYKEKRLRHV